MSKIKVYPWSSVAPDYFGNQSVDSNGEPTDEATRLATALCLALIEGKVVARDKDGSPAPNGFAPEGVMFPNGDYRYVYPGEVNTWLKSQNYLKTWVPSSEADGVWIDKTWEHADDIWQREIHLGKRPTRAEIAKEIAGRLARERVVSATGKPIGDQNILRNGLSGWKPPEPD